MNHDTQLIYEAYDQRVVVKESFIITVAVILAWFVFKNGWKDTIQWIADNPIKTGAAMGAGAIAYGFGQAAAADLLPRLHEFLDMKFSGADPGVIKQAASQIVDKFGDKTPEQLQSMLG